jgi:phage tail sheath protein FI
MPAINATPTPFTGGGAGVAPSILNSQYETALTYFLESYGAGIVSIPEVPSTALSTGTKTISNTVHTSGTSTVYTSTAHGFNVGDSITISSVAPATFAGQKVISSVTTDTFTVLNTTTSTVTTTGGTAVHVYALDAVTLDLIAHANSHSRVVALHGASDDDTTEIKALAQVVQAQDNAEHIAVYYPWVYAPTGTVGANRLIPPSGYVAGARSRAHNQVGPHQPGAGIISDARFINGVATSIDKTAGDALDADCVNAIRVINNRIRIYGARSCSADTANFRYLNAQEVVNYVVVQANRSLEDVLFSLIDGRGGMFASIEAHLVAVMEPLRTLGALYEAFDVNGRRIDFGYTVKCNETLNPLSQLVNGTVTARVGLRVSSVGDSIQVEIIKSNLTASVV